MIGRQGSDPNQRVDRARIVRDSGTRPGGRGPDDSRRRLAPAQRVVASFDSYAAAERAVDHLSDRGFPVERVTVVGRGLKLVEQVTGRLTYAGAAGRSALTGAIIGAAFGWIFGLLGWVNPLISGLLLALYGAGLGAAFGAVFGLVAHALTGGRRDFSSVQGVQADTYELLLDEDVAQEALRLLQTAGQQPDDVIGNRTDRR